MITPRAIVFDLDGTLLDSKADIAAACNHALASLGRAPLSVDDIVSYVGDGARTLCARAARLPENDPKMDAMVRAYLDYYLAHPVDTTRWMPSARRVLDAVRAFPLAICTNKPRAATEAILESLGVRTRFAALVAGGDLAEKKPAPGPVFAVARALGVDAEELVVVGDGDQDVLAGKRAGSRTIGVAGGYCPRDRLAAARPDVLVDRIDEVPAVLSRWAEATTRIREPLPKPRR